MNLTPTEDLFRIEHLGLLNAAEVATRHLAELGRKLRPGSVHYAEHTVFVDRCGSLARYLESAIALAERSNYGPALALIRATLEHRCFDRLLFLANRYVSVAKDVDEAAWRAFEASNRPNRKWIGDIQTARWNARSKTVSIVLRGANVRDEQGKTLRQLSPYYRFVDAYRAYGGSPQDQTGLLRQLVGPSVHVGFAKRRRQDWRGWLVWQALQDNLRTNRLQTSRELLHLRIHYSFLSTFTHPESDTNRELYGNRFDGAGYDHYSSELVLLYACAIASRELDDFLARCHRRPCVAVDEENLIIDAARTARELSAHLWFPGDPPHQLDRVKDANDRLWRRKGIAPYLGLTPPPILDASAIRIDPNPLTRLVAMHRHHNELVGYSFLSPWPRDDALRR